MRELLYVSDSKLDRYFDDRRITVPRYILGEAELSIAGLIKFKIAHDFDKGKNNLARETLKRIDK